MRRETVTCDRCGNEIGGTFGITTIDFGVYRFQERPSLDICVLCSRDLRVWAENKP